MIGYALLGGFGLVGVVWAVWKFLTALWEGI
jgi:hypothetical protein